MKKVKVLLTAVMVALIGSVVASDRRGFDDGMIGIDTVEETAPKYIIILTSRSVGIHSVFLESNFGNVDGCDRSHFGVFDERTPGGKSMLALALSASLSGMKVKVRTDGCLDVTGTAGVTAPKITDIKMFTPIPI